MSAVSVRGAHKSFGTTVVLDGVDLEVASGSVAAVLGPSGCGKTTLLRVIAGFERLHAGTVTVDGREVASAVTHVPPEQRRVGIVPQEGALFPHLSVAGNVGYGLGRDETHDRVEEVLELVGLGGLGARMPHELSGGQQQRVAVARALAPRPPVILLDEPFSALDSGLRAGLREDIRAALNADGATAIIVTHDQTEALSIADTVAVMRAGRIVQSAPPRVLYHHPVDLELAQFVGEALIIAGTMRDGVAHTRLGRLPTSGPGREGDVTVVVRPEQLRLEILRAGALPADGAAVGTVVGLTYHGHDALLRVQLEGQPVEEVSARVLSTEAHGRVGQRVAVRVTGSALTYCPV